MLRVTRGGRATIGRHSFVPLLISARLSTGGVVLSATKEAALVRDWITPQEARRAVAAELRRWRSARINELVVRAGARCGSGCLKVSAEWLDGSDVWTVHGRARQVNGRVRTRLAEAVRQNR